MPQTATGGNNHPQAMDKSIPAGSLRGELTPPCSKSYAQRALAASLLTDGRSVLHNLAYCDDTRAAVRCIETLGASVQRIDRQTLAVEGGLDPVGNRLFVGESGLAARLFTPIAALCGFPVRIEGEGTLLHRPMAMLVEPLRALGVEVRDGGGYLPIEVRGPIRGGRVEVDGSLSSQFVTGLLLALPVAGRDTVIRVHDPVSTPYLDMTIAAAAAFGVEILHEQYREFYIAGGQRYSPAELRIEGDWSAAAALLVAGATAGEVTVRNLSPLSLQADTAICTALERAGAGLVSEADSVTALRRELRAFRFDATQCPDLFPALVALAAAAEGVSVIEGAGRLRSKECDRADALREEYARLGIAIDLPDENRMLVRGGEIRPAEVWSHGDHRIAMSLAVSALRSTGGSVTLHDAEVVSKSYPGFYEALDALRIQA